MPVIVTTVLEDQDIAWALGAAHYLMKPVERERLADILRTYKPGTPNPEKVDGPEVTGPTATASAATVPAVAAPADPAR